MRWSYGSTRWRVQSWTRALALTIGCGLAALAMHGRPAVAADAPLRIVVLGDSLSAGFGLPGNAAFPARLQDALEAKGHDVSVANAGVSGDTAADGLARLDWSVPEGTEAVIVELGANDALRGIDPNLTGNALQAILRRLKQRNIPILLCGMLAPRNMGAYYDHGFDALYPALAAREGVLLYPFFLAGVAADPKLNQADGLHPTAEGVDAIVAQILPKVEELIRQVKAKSPT